MKPGDKVVANITAKRVAETVGIEKGKEYTVRAVGGVEAAEFNEVWLEEVPNWYYRPCFDVVEEKRKLFVLEMRDRAQMGRLPNHTIEEAITEAKRRAKEGHTVTILEAVKVVEPGEPTVREA